MAAKKEKTLEDFFNDELKDLFSAENQLIKALPKMQKAAQAPELKEAFASHLKETQGHVARLEKAGKILDIGLKGKKCKAMEGLLEEGKEVMEELKGMEVIDAGLIAAAQKVEHYEIASYGTVKTYAALLGYKDVAKLLEDTLNEEKTCDETLTELSQTLNAETV